MEFMYLVNKLQKKKINSGHNIKIRIGQQTEVRMISSLRLFIFEKIVEPFKHSSKDEWN